jgi:nitrous oxidase accessory protein NosD
VFTGSDEDYYANGWIIENNTIRNAVVGLYSKYTLKAKVIGNSISAKDEG